MRPSLVIKLWLGYNCGIINAKKMQKRKATLVRQKEIVSAARKLIVRYGSEHVTVKKMAREIGVTEGAIYRHFKSKRDVLSLLVEDVERTLLDDVERNYSREINSLDVLSGIILEHMSTVEQKKGVAFQVIAEIISLGDRKLNKKIYDAINKYTERISQILAEGINNGVIRSDVEPVAAARLFFGMTQGLVNIWALSQYSFELESEYKPLWEVFTRAVARDRPHDQSELALEAKT
jgi:AcrR family transcriptional regulator